jgi:hypothetical protein
MHTCLRWYPHRNVELLIGGREAFELGRQEQLGGTPLIAPETRMVPLIANIALEGALTNSLKIVEIKQIT